jgi:hypothetical protein
MQASMSLAESQPQIEKPSTTQLSDADWRATEAASQHYPHQAKRLTWEAW